MYRTFMPRQAVVLSASPVSSAAHLLAASGKKKKKREEKAWAKLLISGSVTIFFEMAGGHAMEFLKIDKQVTNDSYKVIIQRMVGKKGLAGMLDGFFPWGCAQSMVKGAVFGWGQAASKKMLNKASFLNEKEATVLSGGCGGFVQGVIMSPLLLMKTRVMTDSRFRTSGGVLETSIASFKLGGEIVKKEGAGVLFKGMGVFSFKRFCDWTTRFLFVELVQSAARGGDDSVQLGGVTKALCALAGGSLSALVTVPIDVMVATVQDAGKSGKKVSVVETLRTQFASGGMGDIIRFSTRGLGARVAHVAATTLMMKTVSSAVYDMIFDENE